MEIQDIKGANKEWLHVNIQKQNFNNSMIFFQFYMCVQKILGQNVQCWNMRIHPLFVFICVAGTQESCEVYLICWEERVLSLIRNREINCLVIIKQDHKGCREEMYWHWIGINLC